VDDGDRFEHALDRAIRGLQEPDRRLAHEIAAGVLRQRVLLDRRVDALLTADPRRLQPDLRNLLRIGAYQLLYLDRVPHYAVLSSTVELAKAVKGRRAAGLVNAVLRRLAAEPIGQQMEKRELDLATEHSHPSWLVDRWLARFGPERTGALLEHNNRRPPLTLQAARVTTDSLRDLLTVAGVDFHDAPFGKGLSVRSTRVEAIPGYENGAFIVQDAGQALLLETAAISRDATVWDCCAAPGGKAATLSHRVRIVFASDLRRDRVQVLRDTVTRAAGGVSLFLADATAPPLKPGCIDVVLVDAPCSGTGTIARHPDARWRLSPKLLEQLRDRQASILDAVALVVRETGSVVYLTCSLESEENDEQVESFLDRHPEYERAGDDVFLFPPDSGTDGGYAAHLRRVS
jgi:16S rRNA (cytosine967-C5)-methyltransferase